MSTKFDDKLPTPNFDPPQLDGEDNPPPAYNDPMAKETSLDEKHLTPKAKDSEIDIDVHSVTSNTSTLADLSDTLLPNIPFTPGSTYHISARGVGAFRLPFPSSELEIDIFNPDGSVAYTSTRARKSKGDCILSSPNKGDLISTNYFFGPSRQPIIRDLSKATHVSLDTNADSKDLGLFEIKSKWTSRSITMQHTPSGRVFEWSYDKVKTSDGKKANLLVLRLLNSESTSVANSESLDWKNKVLAQLIRSEKTRTPGTRGCTAGNGGQLVIDSDATASLDEPLIVSTCLMMLKKEIDRRRAVQFAVLAGGAGGGGG